MDKIAISSTIPIEIPYSANYSVFDLNNLFITSSSPEKLVTAAHNYGLSRTTCSWTKGVFAAAITNSFKKIINVVTGDCTNNHAMGEILKLNGLEIIPFYYPYPRNKNELKNNIEKFKNYFDVDDNDVRFKFEEFQRIRNLLVKIDNYAIEGKVKGDEFLSYLISGSDMQGDPDIFQVKIEAFLKEVESRKNLSSNKLRIAIIGIPPIYSDIFVFLESLNVVVVYLETAVEFGRVGDFSDIVEAYYQYSYPYELKYRVEKIKKEIKRRDIDAVINYTQTFCFHRNEHLIFEKELGLPVLRIEGDLPGPMDESTKLRIETFISSLRNRTRKDFIPPILTMDLGSRSVKLLFYDNGNISYEVIDTIEFIKKFILNSKGKKVKPEEVINKIFRKSVQKVKTISTGYGRHQVIGKNIEVLSEIEAHFLAVKNEFPNLNDYTILDLGGQDTKIIQVKNKVIHKFIMNDKCAAGSGRYLENMSRILGISIEELGNFYDNPEHMNITCATFGETELVGKMIKGVPIEQLAAGINWSVFKRSLFFVKKLYSPVLILSGGVALNNAIVRFFKESGEFKEVFTLTDPQTAGVRGLLYYILDEKETIGRKNVSSWITLRRA